MITGGLKPSGSPRERLRAALAVLDTESGEVVRRAWLDDPDLEPAGCHREATAPAWVDGQLLVPSRAAVYTVDPTSLVGERAFEHPLFSDLHSVSARGRGGVWVSSTGIDAVLGLAADGTLEERIDLAEPVAGVDFRGVGYGELKPHAVHPNHAVEWGGSLWVTRFEQRDAVSQDGRRISFPEGMPHDGRLCDGLVWFTTVTGQVVAVDPEDLTRREEYDLHELSGTRRALGWCRGIEVLGDRVFVGMTQLRKSAHIEMMRWVIRGEAGRLAPTRVVEICRSDRRIVREIVVGNRAGGSIHGLLSLTPPGG